MGWEKTLLPRGGRLLDIVEDSALKTSVPYNEALAWGPDGARAASPNHEAVAWACELLRGAINGTPEQLTRAIDVVIGRYVPRDLGEGPYGIGLWSRELGCPDAHGGIHLAGVGVLQIAALYLNNPVLLSAARRLVSANTCFLLSVASRDLDVWMPGVRAGGAPVSSAASGWLREVKGRAHTGSLRKPDHADWTFPNYLGVRAMRTVRRRWPAEAALWEQLAAGPVATKYPVTVWRWPSGFLARMDAPEGPEVILWTQKGLKGPEYGRRASEAPAPPGQAKVVRHGPRGKW